MHRTREQNSRYSRVTAVFEDRALSFGLAKGATLEELADRLADLGQRQNRRPVAITVKFGSILAQSWLSPSTGRPPGRLHGLRQRMDAENFGACKCGT